MGAQTRRARYGVTVGGDDCDVGVMCWFLDEELTGECVALCEGTPENPQCPPYTHCPIVAEGVLNLCLPMCDPLLQDCMENETCPGLMCANPDFYPNPDCEGSLVGPRAHDALAELAAWRETHQR